MMFRMHLQAVILIDVLDASSGGHLDVLDASLGVLEESSGGHLDVLDAVNGALQVVELRVEVSSQLVKHVFAVEDLQRLGVRVVVHLVRTTYAQRKLPATSTRRSSITTAAATTVPSS